MYHNNYPLGKKLGELLRVQNLKLSVAESCTGGALARVITSVPGASEYFESGFVTYSNAAKIAMLGVDPHVIKEYGAVSKETAYEMAVGALQKSGSDLAVSITGIAGPDGGSEEKPVGTVWFGLVLKNGHCECRKQVFTSGRKHIRVSAVRFALLWMLQTLDQK